MASVSNKLVSFSELEDFKGTEYEDLFIEYTYENESGDEVTVMGVVVRAGPFEDDLQEGFLEAQTNFRDHPSDITSSNLITSDLSDTEFITKILDNHSNYIDRQEVSGNNVPVYSLPTSSRTFGIINEDLPNIYNSNSYISGIIRASGANPIEPDVRTPLYANPVPRIFFTPTINR
ncbi:MAG: hypothetical protein ED557_12040 [Balneola sp.]|nr:MAG: hypothetical protein ED557_12040 [Balneola sp.]